MRPAYNPNRMGEKLRRTITHRQHAKGPIRMRMLLATFCLQLTLVALSAEPAKAEQPPNLGSRLELFVDDYLIDILDGVRLKLHAPQSAGKIIIFDKPWEGTTSLYHTVFQDGDSYRMYYRGSSHQDYADQAQLLPGEEVIPKHETVIALIESPDGITWHRPSLGLIEFEGSKDNNIVWKGQASCCFAPFKDGNPEAPPEELYKALGNAGTWPNHALMSFVSADGKRWRLASEKPAITDGKFDSLNVPFWDPVRGQYAAVYRDSDGVREHEIRQLQRFPQLDSRPVGRLWEQRPGTPLHQRHLTLLPSPSHLHRPPQEIRSLEDISPNHGNCRSLRGRVHEQPGRRALGSPFHGGLHPSRT